jgi:4-carboxymuconolactone decarboxylase
MSESEQFKKGLEVRRAVLGAEYVDASLAAADDFLMAFQRLTTEWCWGYAWARPGLDRRTRSLLNLAMLTALNRPAELRLHVKGALTNGVTAEEIKEVLLHATVYCGIPAGLEAFKAAHEVLKAAGALPGRPAKPSVALAPRRGRARVAVAPRSCGGERVTGRAVGGWCVSRWGWLRCIGSRAQPRSRRPAAAAHAEGLSTPSCHKAGSHRGPWPVSPAAPGACRPRPNPARALTGPPRPSASSAVGRPNRAAARA